LRGSPRDARNYELMTVFSPDVPEDEIQGTIDRVVGYITTATGELVDVSRDSPWGRRRLAYPIRHASRDVRDGFYTLYHFLVAPHRVEEIERELRLNDRVMRYMVTQYTPRPVEETAPTAEVTEGAEAPPAETEPVTASAEVEATTEEPAAAVAEEPETPAVTEPVEDVAEEVEATAPDDDKADTEDAAPPEEE
jgi:small subunit ribosomal protein S6